MPRPGQPIRIALDQGSVSGLLQLPDAARALYVFAHGAGAGMAHAFMGAMSDALEARGIATLRYQFPYMERGSKRPDAPGVAHAAVRAAVFEAARQAPGLPLFAGGKSFGGRMTSQAHAARPLEGVRGLAFVGFPLHAAKTPSIARAEHLSNVNVPMLFLQGTRDELADLDLIRGVTGGLPKATLHVVDGADHAFHVLARSGRNDGDVLAELARIVREWADGLLT
jgi:predicted alpha/beta-hydrolase family hydrolase